MLESFLPLVKFALSEDVGTGDVTTLNSVPPNVGARAAIVAKEPGVLSGLEIAMITFRALQVMVRHWRQGWSVLERPGEVEA